MTVISISKPLKDIKDSSFETYTGGIEFIEEKSSRYTFIYKLNDLNDVYLEADRDFTEASVTKCEAKVVYAANSKKILELEVIED